MAQPPGILLVANWESGVGYAWWLMENFWAEIARHYVARGHRCFVVFPKISEIPALLKESQVRFLEHDFADTRPASVARLIRLIRQHRIRYTYLTDKPITDARYALLRLAGIVRIVVHNHSPGDYSYPVGIKRLAKTAFHKLPWINADHVIGATPFVRERLIQTACIPPERCSYAKNGISHIGRDPALRFYCHAELNLPQNATIVFSAGRATYYKGIDFIIRCATLIAEKPAHRNVFFVYCGDGPDLPEFRGLARRLGVENRFVFAGRRGDVDRLVQSCHIGIQASFGEVGYSLSILEYMSAGLATLVPDRPSTRLATVNDVTGVLFAPNDVGSACRQLERLLSRHDLRARLARNAMNAVSRDYRLSDTNRALISILDGQFNTMGERLKERHEDTVRVIQSARPSHKAFRT